MRWEKVSFQTVARAILWMWLLVAAVPAVATGVLLPRLDAVTSSDAYLSRVMGLHNSVANFMATKLPDAFGAEWAHIQAQAWEVQRGAPAPAVAADVVQVRRDLAVYYRHLAFRPVSGQPGLFVRIEKPGTAPAAAAALAAVDALRRDAVGWQMAQNAGLRALLQWIGVVVVFLTVAIMGVLFRIYGTVIREMGILEMALQQIADGRWDTDIDRGSTIEEFARVRAVFRAAVGQIQGAMADFAERAALQETELEARRLELARSHEQIRHMAYHDALTDLPNRSLLLLRLDENIRVARETGGMVAVMFCDVDRFKQVNDTLGHTAGDQLLKDIAIRIVGAVPEMATVSRIGGDEFTVVVPVSGVPEAEGVARRLMTAFQAPWRDMPVSLSIGVALYPLDGLSMDVLLMHADLALYRAKELGRNLFQFYVPGLGEKIADAVGLEAEIRQALREEQFAVYYQPQVEARTGRIVGVEALVRWPQADGSVRAPDQFIGVAEAAGLIVPLGEWILREACRQLAAWQDLGLGALRMAVNLSARQLDQDDFVERVLAILEETGIDPSGLELELTESMAMRDPELTVRVFTALRARGARVMLDDFGVGMSSLYYIRDLPIDGMKIDQSYIRMIGDISNDAILRTIIGLAHSLHLHLVAEGVETAEQEAFLRDHGCEVLQGYRFARPMPAAAMEQLLRNQAGVPRPAEAGPA